jgi:hypothetical protein
MIYKMVRLKEDRYRKIMELPGRTIEDKLSYLMGEGSIPEKMENRFLKIEKRISSLERFIEDHS